MTRFKWSEHIPLVSVWWLLLIILEGVYTFNLSPRPNLKVKDPGFVTPMLKLRSSYFGFSINLRPGGIIVGAPRAQSTIEAQRNLDEPGAIYKCSLFNGTCSPYVFDAYGNRTIEMSEYAIESEARDYQWLGAAMDGGRLDSDKLVVCAPRFITPTENDYHLHGVCYWIRNTLGDKPVNVTKILPLRAKDEQVVKENGEKYYNFILAEMGLSVHVTDNNEEFLIGAPGIHTWKGSVIRYRKKKQVDDPIASRRDTTSRLRHTRAADAVQYAPAGNYESERHLNPENWGQPSDSYFGYSVTSGYFDSANHKKLLYGAGAPQANEQSGEAYIFDITGKTIIKHATFRGEQFGEYFGYGVLAEDLNNDGLSDLIVSAPQYSFPDSHDNGAIYVFINLGNFNFEKKLLTSPITESGRFGSALSRLGDINRDGYNDIAVGAPFVNNGSVFIYLGDEKGIRDKPSQILNSPLMAQSKYGAHMFGHGLSKGSDIDKNEYNDLAIGAPNAEAVYVYRAYPVVKISATLNSKTREIKPEQTKFKVTACYDMKTASSTVRQQDLTIRLVLDPQAKRVKFTHAESNELRFNVTAGLTKECRDYDCDVRFSVTDIFRPIELEMHYDVIHQVPDAEFFCESCVAVDPATPKVYVERIIFSTGCKSDICVADLRVTSSDISSDYILGSSTVLRINYEITNDGETAYLPQLNVTSSNRMGFAQVPWNCKIEDGVILLCDLNRGQPLAKGSTDSISVSFDVSSISGHSMIITAEVFSTGREFNMMDNIIKNTIILKEYTEVEVIGAQANPQIDLEHYKKSAEIINNYEIKSNGPSTVGALDIVFHLPVAYKISGLSSSIVDVSNITMQAVYDGQLVGVDLIDQNNTQILMETIEISTSTGISHAQKTMITHNGMNYDAVKSGHVHEVYTSEDVTTASMSRRRRHRSSREITAQTSVNRVQYARVANARAHEFLSEDFKGKLPVNRTIVFSCKDHELTVCVRAKLHIYNFKPEKPITVRVQYHANLDEINQILVEPWDFFVMLIDVDVYKQDITDVQSLKVISKIEPVIISKHQMAGTPIWVIILAILGGLLLLAAITYGMYKAGFFKRQTKEEMDKLVHQGQIAPEAENLNSENN